MDVTVNGCHAIVETGLGGSLAVKRRAISRVAAAITDRPRRNLNGGGSFRRHQHGYRRLGGCCCRLRRRGRRRSRQSRRCTGRRWFRRARGRLSRRGRVRRHRGWHHRRWAGCRFHLGGDERNSGRCQDHRQKLRAGGYKRNRRYFDRLDRRRFWFGSRIDWNRVSPVGLSHRSRRWFSRQVRPGRNGLGLDDRRIGRRQVAQDQANERPKRRYHNEHQERHDGDGTTTHGGSLPSAQQVGATRRRQSSCAGPPSSSNARMA